MQKTRYHYQLMDVLKAFLLSYFEIHPLVTFDIIR